MGQLIKIVYEPEEKRAAAYDGDQFIGESTYSDSGNLWIIDHTVVDDKYTGQQIAGKLVLEIVNQAREKGIKTIPLCPFAIKEFQKKEEYADVWKR